jgi:tetratricopeptide (TPR) repeat protein
MRSRGLELALLGARARRGVRALGGSAGPEPHTPGAFVQSLLEQGSELERQGAFADALIHFRKAAALDGACADAHQGRLRTAARAGDPAEVIEAGRAALALDPKGGKYYVWLAQAMLAARSDGELVGWLDSLAEAHAPPRAFGALAELTSALGDAERARLWSARAAHGAKDRRA